MKRGLRVAGTAIAGAAILAAVFHTQLLMAMGSYLDRSAPPQKAEVIFVLAGDTSGNRILTAAELVRRGYAPKILVSGPEGYYGLNESDLAIPFAEHAGYPAAYFQAFPHSAHSTREEAQVAAQEFRKLGFHRVLLVTSNFHTRRAGNLFRAAAPEVAFTVVEAPDAYFTIDGWWHDREGRKIFLLEWTKTVAGWMNL